MSASVGLQPPFREMPLAADPDNPKAPRPQWSHVWLRYIQALNDLANNNTFDPSSPPPIGDVTPNSGAFTALSASGIVSGAGFVAWAGFPPPIGITAPNSGAFTALSASGAISGAGFVAWAGSPPPIGGAAPNVGIFTTLIARGYFYVSANEGGTQPTAEDGAAIGWNYSNGSAEVDYFNTTTALTPGWSHVFYQRNPSGPPTWLVGIDAAGNLQATSVRVASTGGPTWTAGNGAPSSTQPLGSLWSREDGAIGSTLYVSRGGGTWNAVAGV